MRLKSNLKLSACVGELVVGLQSFLFGCVSFQSSFRHDSDSFALNANIFSKCEVMPCPTLLAWLKALNNLNERSDVPQQQQRIKAAIGKRHRNYVWWRWCAKLVFDGISVSGRGKYELWKVLEVFFFLDFNELLMLIDFAALVRAHKHTIESRKIDEPDKLVQSTHTSTQSSVFNAMKRQQKKRQQRASTTSESILVELDKMSDFV